MIFLDYAKLFTGMSFQQRAVFIEQKIHPNLRGVMRTLFLRVPQPLGSYEA